jgi:hypothetical protein
MQIDEIKQSTAELPPGACPNCGGEGQVQGVCATSPENPEGVYAEICKRCNGSGQRTFTYEELVVACENFGLDLTCPACAALFYTGASLGEHTCPSGGPATAEGWNDATAYAGGKS